MSPYQFVDILTVSKRPWADLSAGERKAFTPYMVNRFLSMNPELIEVVNFMQLHTIPPQQVYQLYSGFLPSQKTYHKYIKKSKENTNGALLKILAEVYRLSQREITEYLNIIPEEKIKKLLVGKGYSQKEIKKMMK